MDDLFRMHAEICKTFANPKRLEVINALREGEKTASELLKDINISKANLSQHMAILIEKGVVLSRREGLKVFYKLSDKKITMACDLMRQVLISHLEENNRLLKKFKK